MRISPTVYEIDPRRHAGDRWHAAFLGIFWLVWTPATLFVTGIAATGEGPQAFLLVWLLFGWLGVVLIPWVLLTRHRRQRLEASTGNLVVLGAGLLPWSRCEIARGELEALTLEHYDEESVVTLNLFHGGRFTRRILLAAFVHPDAKETLFHDIAAFLGELGFAFETRNERVQEGCPRT